MGDVVFFGEYLAVYYKRLYPYSDVFRWLSYGQGSTLFANREFSFILKDDIYVRHLSFSNPSEMQAAVVQRCPWKIDVGPIYNFRPKDHKTVRAGSIEVVEKELVFDIDLTDFDDVRKCCKGASMCPKCWKLLVIAAKILNAALREDFGFSHLLWVYSGRRGIHCWVCDQKARVMSQRARGAVAEYLSLIVGNEKKRHKVQFGDNRVLHPSFSRALAIIDSYFVDYALRQQDSLRTEEDCRLILDLFDSEEFSERIQSQLASMDSSLKKWRHIESCVNSTDSLKWRRSLVEVKMFLCYPRLDVEVTRGMNHLLKSPFSVHPKTGRVCIPIDFERIDDFDPLGVPLVGDLVDQLKVSIAGGSSSTSLDASMNVFREFVGGLERSDRPRESYNF